MLVATLPLAAEQLAPLLGELSKVLFTAFLTILTFVFGQIFMKFAEPAFKLREEIGAMAQDLEMYANDDEKIADAQERLKIFRSHASKLHGILSMILPYDLWQQLFQLPEKRSVEGACKEIFRLSNLQVESREMRTPAGPYATGLRIRELLKIRSLTDGKKGFLRKNEQPFNQAWLSFAECNRPELTPARRTRIVHSRSAAIAVAE